MIAKVLVETTDMSEEEWRKHRMKGIGGSDAAAVMGMSPYKSPLQVYYEKTGQIEAEDLSENERIKWGNRLEGPVRDAFVEETGKPVIEIPAILYHPDHPHMLANLDGLAEHSGIVYLKDGTTIDLTKLKGVNAAIFEAKSADKIMGMFFGDEKDGEDDTVPEYYLIQVMHYMAVTGLDVGYLAVLIGGNDFRWYTIPRNEQMIEAMIALQEEFWFNVETRTPPPADGSKACGEFIGRMFPQSVKTEVILEPDMWRYVDQLRVAQKEKKFRESRFDEAKHFIQLAAGVNSEIKIRSQEDPNVLIDVASWRQPKTSRVFDKKGFQVAEPGMYKKHMIDHENARKFLVSKKK